MDYQFPVITNLQQVTDVLERSGKSHLFAIKDNGIETVVCYTFQTAETFALIGDTFTPDDAIIRELRGITFDSQTGDVICRKFHKFFNLGQGVQYDDLDLSKPHTVLLKLDGSMIAAYCHNGNVVFSTKKGQTDIAAVALNHVSHSIRNMVKDMYAKGWCLLFEYTSPNNQIVIEYKEEQLTLLAARQLVSGEYMSYEMLTEVGKQYGCTVVETVNVSNDDIRDNLTRFTEIEGVVIRFNDGHMIKVKTEEYLSKHHDSTCAYLSDTRIIRAIATDTMDDFMQFINDHTRSRVKEWQEYLENKINGYLTQYYYVMETNYQSNKEMAAAFINSLPKSISKVCLSYRRKCEEYGATPTKDGMYSAIMDIIAFKAGSLSRLQELTDLFDGKMPQRQVG